ncbi:alpha-L-rhamnosidase [Arthrobacter sp. MYb23]|uniref:glycoside hydrolase family 78 protein n=1 Tax=unclassified Arthrobacter TaxID=235627 RepID=UPI000CFD4544|nr:MULTISPECIES: glycoside hydrolase family 78 protein [unclassified Arthrobacter]PRB43491.1 alpha-L-rhamnosidase [Arthrobacter sp. MYb51]PRB93735.1 alpha-L-rhamnosidase [Arthrobacter sp. MYb23]
MPATVHPATFEHLPPTFGSGTLGIGLPTPRISWKTSAEPGWVQEAYQVSVTTAEEQWTSERTESKESVLVPWEAAPLGSAQRAEVSVRVWGAGDQEPSDWSQPSTVETGLLEPGDWTATAITPAWDEDPEADRRPPLLRSGFTVDRPVASARLYVTAHGLYEVEINGVRVGDDALSPGWTVYGQRLRYYTYDVTQHVADGDNAIGAFLADGWYRGRIGFKGGYANLYGNNVALLAQLHITHDDGSVTVVGTDESWKASFGPILVSSLYKGESYDARELPKGWSSPAFDDSGWEPVTGVERDPGTLVAPEGPPVRCTEEIRPVRVWTSPMGKILLDFGQNLVGRLRITVIGDAGSTVTLRHAEVLQDGELYTRPLRGADSTDHYTLSGSGEERWEPRFTIHGFRYAEISGWTGGDIAENVTARVYHTDMERTGWFESSNPDLNRLHENVLWSMKGNFVDIPTDCPQRDERLGWTGDIQVFAPTASFLYDCSGMLSSWLKDVAAEQLPDGTVPWYVPVIPGGNYWTPIRPGAVWGDVAVLTPWALHERFNDPGILAAQYVSAKAWVDLQDRLAGESRLWNGSFQLGDWLDPTAPPEDPTKAMTDKHLVATAYFAWSARHLAMSAAVLGKSDDELRYLTLSREVAAAFAREYIHPDGIMSSDAQTAYALALVFDLFPDADSKARAGFRLAELVRANGNRIGTGFAGTPVVSDALTLSGEIDAAYDLLLETECPSWLYAVGQGGTTIWERWDSMLPDGSINPGEMTSFNHYALGAVADWMHRVVAGLAPLEPGYRKILVKPQPGGGLSWASARHETPYGTASVQWRIDDGGLTVVVEIPTGTTARVELPGQDPLDVGSGRHEFAAQLVS